MIGEATRLAIPFRRLLQNLTRLSPTLHRHKESEVMLSRKSGYGKREKRKGVKGQIELVSANAAGIDIGSEKHFVAVPSDRAEEPVRSFGCYTADLREMALWLLECRIETVAMESTGVYWVPVYLILESYGIDVKLVDARHAKNVPGRKTDVCDCQWLQQLHSYGLLRGCFIPDRRTRTLREYWRQRQSLVESASREILHMQKSLEQMNIQLHKAISDITGVTGMLMIRAIVRGERRPIVLAGMRARGIKKSEAEIVKALTGDYREEHLFTLKQSLELYDILQQKIAECDRKVQEHLSTYEAKVDTDSLKALEAKNWSRRKNQPYFDLRQELYRVTGVDLTRIDGISSLTAQIIISEIGLDVSAFASEKQFASYLTLSPENRITGGKVRRRSTRRSSNRVAASLRLSAQSLERSDSALGAYYRRMKARLGAPKAITATAHKLACLIYRALRYGMEYVDIGQNEYERRFREQQLKSLNKRASALGYDLVPTAVGVVS